MLDLLAVGLLLSCQTEAEEGELAEDEKLSPKRLEEVWFTERDRGCELFSASWDNGTLKEWGEGVLNGGR